MINNMGQVQLEYNFFYFSGITSGIYLTQCTQSSKQKLKLQRRC